jgi:phage protein D
VALGDSADGSDLSFLVLDAGRSAWEHIARLARVSGHLARITEDNKLDFRPPDEGEPVQSFTWGVDIMALDRIQTEQSFDAVTIAGEGAAGSQGKDAWNWLTKTASSVTGSAGGGSKTRPFTDRALRSGDAVQAAADAIAAAAARAATTGVLLVPGAPKVVPGKRITLASTPGGTFDGDFLVTRVRHSYDKRSGFRTRINFSGTGSGGAAGGGLAGLIGGLL